MNSRRIVRHHVFVILAGACLAVLVPAAPAQEKVKNLRSRAELFERQGDWDKACDVYEELLRGNRNAPDLRERYRACLRHLFQARRQLDPTYRKEVLNLKYSQALELYRIVLFNLNAYALDRNRATPERLFHKGLEEFRNALADPVFRREHLNGVKPEDVRDFRDQLNLETLLQENGGKPLTTLQDSRDLLRVVAIKALKKLRLSATLTVMEFTCGACHAIDDYTMYLTPGQLRDLTSALKGEVVGIGVRLGRQGDKLMILDVIDGGPAADADTQVFKGEFVLSIDRKAVAELAPELAAELLEGEIGTTVELVLVTPGMGPRTVTLRRRALFVPSVSYKWASATIGYVQISCFQETTLQELDEALAALTKPGSGVKALILDLRGNGGGLFDVAIEVARRFLRSGTIVTRQTFDFQQKTYDARNPTALTLPLVVLIDGDTASSAEILAGALKDNNKRARLVGQTTFGKSCLQRPVALPAQGKLKIPEESGGFPTGGLRLTVARFLSPRGEPYTDRGVTPHLFAEKRVLSESMMPLDDVDGQYDLALTEALRLIDNRR